MKTHGDITCPKFNDEALPDEDGDCSLCGAELIEQCEDCGHTAETGACFYCKMD